MIKYKIEDFKIGDYVMLSDGLFENSETNIRIDGYDKYINEPGRVTGINDDSDPTSSIASLTIDDYFGSDLEYILKIVTKENNPEYWL